VRSVAPLVREDIARANDLVILRALEVGTSLDVIHSIFAGLNSDSSCHGHQKSVSPSNERLRLVVGKDEWVFYGSITIHRLCSWLTVFRLFGEPPILRKLRNSHYDDYDST
jgi:hypothetical protein